jgi:hypothetical protein
MASEFDISNASHGKRLDHYLDQYGGKSDGTPARMVKRAQAYDLAHNAATVEMLDEIHLMLRVLSGVDNYLRKV